VDARDVVPIMTFTCTRYKQLERYLHDTAREQLSMKRHGRTDVFQTDMSDQTIARHFRRACLQFQRNE
jgi:hypothetical protein